MFFIAIFSLIIYALLAFFRPHWGIYVILLLLPSYQIRFPIFNIPTTYLEWLILILAAAVFVRAAISSDFKNTTTNRLLSVAQSSRWLILFILIFLLSAATAIVVSPLTIKALGLFKAYFFEGLLFWLLFILLIDNKQKLFNTIKALGALVVVLSLFGIYQFFTLCRLPPSWWGPGLEPRRIVSLYTYPNAVALLIAPVLAIFSTLIIFKEKVKEFISGSFLIWVNILGIILLLLTFSRGAWIGYVAAILFLSLFSKYKKLIIVLLVVGVAGILLAPTSRDRLMPIFTGTDPASFERVKLYTGTWEIIKSEPVFGAGLYGFRWAYDDVRKDNTDEVLNYPHNIFLNFWVELGLLGLLALLAILLTTIKSGIVLYKENPEVRPLVLALFAALAVWFVHGQVDAPFFKNDLSILFWFLIGIVPVIKLLNNNAKIQNKTD